MTDVLRLTVRPEFIDSELHLTLYQNVVPNVNTGSCFITVFFAVTDCIKRLNYL